jgi:hypothetical protein
MGWQAWPVAMPRGWLHTLVQSLQWQLVHAFRNSSLPLGTVPPQQALAGRMRPERRAVPLAESVSTSPALTPHSLLHLPCCQSAATMQLPCVSGRAVLTLLHLPCCQGQPVARGAAGGSGTRPGQAAPQGR